MSNLIKFYGTGKYKELHLNKEYFDVPDLVELLVKKGFASYEPIEEKEKAEVEPIKKKIIKKPTTKKLK